MTTVTKIWCRPVTYQIVRGKVNLETGIAHRKQDDVTDEVIFAMALRFLAKPEPVVCDLDGKWTVTLTANIEDHYDGSEE